MTSQFQEVAPCQRQEARCQRDTVRAATHEPGRLEQERSARQDGDDSPDVFREGEAERPRAVDEADLAGLEQKPLIALREPALSPLLQADENAVVALSDVAGVRTTSCRVERKLAILTSPKLRPTIEAWKASCGPGASVATLSTARHTVSRQ